MPRCPECQRNFESEITFCVYCGINLDPQSDPKSKRDTPKALALTNTRELPVCPYCEKELDRIAIYDKGFFERHYVYTCPYCRKILSIGFDSNWT